MSETTEGEAVYAGGVNIAMKIPRAQYEATVAFYRDTLGFELEEADSATTPTISRSCRMRFGPTTLWLDCVDNYARSDVWLELVTPDLAAAKARLAADGVVPCDEVEPIEGADFRSHWVRNPAGVVHLLVEDAGG